MIKEVLILRTVFLMTVDEAFYKPENKRTEMQEGHYLHRQEAAAKANAEITCTQINQAPAY